MVASVSPFEEMKVDSEKVDGSAKVDEVIRPVPFMQLFRFASGRDKTLMIVGISLQLIVGCGMSAMNLIFGEMLDDLSATAGSVEDVMQSSIHIMLGLAVFMGFTALIAMSSIPYAAARIANTVRLEYLRAVLRQDMEFFDTAKPGTVVSAITSDTMDFELGISVKLGEGVQAFSGVISGFIVAFIFSWKISLVCCAVLPVLTMGFAIMYVFIMNLLI